MSTELTETQQNTDNSAISLIENINLQTAQTQLQAISSFQKVVNETLVKGQDFGIIPGTEKPTLLKPGAEKILMILGLSSEYSIINKVENYDAGFFAYTVQATLYKNEQLITQGIGSANTKETRYRKNTYKNGRKVEWNGEYQDAYTLQNTVLKMAKKRAQIDATLTVGSLSNVFTQDMEDLQEFHKAEQMHNVDQGKGAKMVINFGLYKGQTLEAIYKKDASYIDWLSQKANQPAMRKAAKMLLDRQDNKSNYSESQHVSPTAEQIKEAEQLVNEIASAEKTTQMEILKNNGIQNLKNLTPDQCNRLIKKLHKDLDKCLNKAKDPLETAMDNQVVDNDMPF